MPLWFPFQENSMPENHITRHLSFLSLGPLKLGRTCPRLGAQWDLGVGKCKSLSWRCPKASEGQLSHGVPRYLTTKNRPKATQDQSPCLRKPQFCAQWVYKKLERKMMIIFVTHNPLLNDVCVRGELCYRPSIPPGC